LVVAGISRCWSALWLHRHSHGRSADAGGRRWPAWLTDTGFLSIAGRLLQELPGAQQHALLTRAQAMVTVESAQPPHHFGYLGAVPAAEPFKICLIASAPARFATVMHCHVSIMTGISAGAILI
jgi:hypothetical protein